ncbi:hypothetical protein FRC08_003185 [Ceratobasidium sp. 394]|nr:hypothetical protein FRC08_003185 [Ceratobasidium sp. 394]
MTRQHFDTISPLPQLWNRTLAIYLSSSASPSPANTSDVLQVCSNFISASLRQPRSNSRGLASVYRNVVGSGQDKVSPELFCRTIPAGLTSPSYVLVDDYHLPPDFLLQLDSVPSARANQSPIKTPARQTHSRTLPPTRPAHDPFFSLSDNLPGMLFPIRAVLSRPVAHPVAEPGPAQLLALVEMTAHVLFRWIESDEMIAGSRLREPRADALVSSSMPERKASDVRSLAPRVCARIGDWTAMALTDVWAWPTDTDSSLDALGKAAMALGRVAEALEHQAGSTSVWVDVGDPFCVLSCMYLSKAREGDEGSKIAATLGLLPLTTRNCNILAGTLASLEDHPPDDVCAHTCQSRVPVSRNNLAPARTQQTEAECEVEEMLEDAEAWWDALEGAHGYGDKDGWRWARNKWRWDEITNIWVERSKGLSGLEYVPRTKNTIKMGKKTNIILILSDTEGGQAMDEDDEVDEDDVSAAIPTTTKYVVPRWHQSSVRPQSRPRPRTRGTTYVSLDTDSDYSAPDARTKPRTCRRPSFWVDDSESETETKEDEIEASETDESDFDWAQYNGRYHPHNRVLSGGSGTMQSKESLPKRTNPAPRNQLGSGGAPVQSTLKPTQVISTPIPVTAPVHAPALAKKPHVVVEIPLHQNDQRLSQTQPSLEYWAIITPPNDPTCFPGLVPQLTGRHKILNTSLPRLLLDSAESFRV